MGPFSQTLAALNSSVSKLRSIQELPGDAVPIQNSVCNSLIGILKDAAPFQTALLGYTGSAITALNGALADLKKGASPGSIAKTVSDVAATISTYQQSATSLLTQSNAAAALMSSSFTQLAHVEGSIQSQMTTLQAQEGAARGQLAAAQKRYYYLLALGPFGLPGLAAALGLYLKWKSDAAAIQNRINSLSSQIGVLQGLVTACKTLATAEASSLSDLTNLKTAIDDTAADFTVIINDLDQDPSPSVVELRLTTCIAMLGVLQADAS
ncbi:hypothetical protein B0G69_7807 [Paraburkholderia sp. RAU2J]|uniref:hypothetical protein n=1 Tax=Paraburkholderia sp. RAU2J TaxID=1938810 RepID=UPI000EB0CB53|nr:hypothetical protein [Paraburkholderia sp. RAU2J]RKT10418.1 hypothetical protein B0G69_7807 [Paraburkholderia sp. RAU2J]